MLLHFTLVHSISFSDIILKLLCAKLYLEQTICLPVEKQIIKEAKINMRIKQGSIFSPDLFNRISPHLFFCHNAHLVQGLGFTGVRGLSLGGYMGNITVNP